MAGLPRDQKPPWKEKHGLHKFHVLKWSDPEQIDAFMVEGLSEEELERAKQYLRTMAEEDALNLSSFEMKRVAIAMLALDRGDRWFFLNANEGNWDELRIELQKFLGGKEEMIINTLQKAREHSKPKGKSLYDQLSEEFKNFDLKAEGVVEGIEYTFETKKKTKAKMLQVQVEEKEGVE